MRADDGGVQRKRTGLLKVTKDEFSKERYVCCVSDSIGKQQLFKAYEK